MAEDQKILSIIDYINQNNILKVSQSYVTLF